VPCACTHTILNKMWYIALKVPNLVVKVIRKRHAFQNLISHQKDVTVYTGTLGVLEYPNINNQMTPFYLMNLTSQLYLPVPKYMWTLLYNKGKDLKSYYILFTNTTFLMRAERIQLRFFSRCQKEKKGLKNCLKSITNSRCTPYKAKFLNKSFYVLRTRLSV